MCIAFKIINPFGSGVGGIHINFILHIFGFQSFCLAINGINFLVMTDHFS